MSQVGYFLKQRLNLSFESRDHTQVEMVTESSTNMWSALDFFMVDGKE